MKPIYWIMGILVLVIWGIAWYSLRSKTRALNSGDVVVRDQAGDKTPETALNQPAQPPGPAAGETSGSQPVVRPKSGVVAPPAADTISRNPPNGMVFAGSGKYQLYRQGDITWRLNTDTGWACVLFATDMQWSKPRVYQQGCGVGRTISQ